MPAPPCAKGWGQDESATSPAFKELSIRQGRRHLNRRETRHDRSLVGLGERVMGAQGAQEALGISAGGVLLAGTKVGGEVQKGNHTKAGGAQDPQEIGGDQHGRRADCVLERRWGHSAVTYS